MLESEKVKLRALEESDLDILLLWHNDLNNKKSTMSHPFPVNNMLETEWLHSILMNKSNRNVYFGIVDKSSNKLAGVTFLRDINLINRNCYFGIYVGSDSNRTKGLGKESLQLLTDYAFNQLNINKILLEVVSFNEAAINLYEKFGFVKEGCLKNQFFSDGSYHDVLIYSYFNDLKK